MSETNEQQPEVEYGGWLRREVRRIWECPLCHRQRRAGGRVVAVSCDCNADSGEEPALMKLIQDEPSKRPFSLTFYERMAVQAGEADDAKTPDPPSQPDDSPAEEKQAEEKQAEETDEPPGDSASPDAT
ncbi:MAG: hypothetical protein N2C14_22790 [Planctomycetales bacterium]